MSQAKYAVVFGRSDFFAEEGLRTVFISSAQEVREMAEEFITVIPDELDFYQKNITDWDGQSVLFITHQDDDTFYFSATPITSPSDLTDFHSWVQEFKVED